MNFSHVKELIEGYIEGQNHNIDKFKLYEPVNYIMHSEAKRFRPVLLIMAYNLFKTEPKEVLPAAYAIEIFHNFTLLHDDIMDAALLRRSQPAAHIKFGTNKAILSGDVMMMLCYQYLLQNISANNSLDILGMMTNTAIEICEGQSLDMQFEERTEVEVEEYIEMITFKTAVLLAMSLKMGGALGGASSGNQENLYQFGLNLGIAFQIQDDVLDAFGNEALVGKEIGGDIQQKKKTYLITSAMKYFPENDKQYLIKLFSSSKELNKSDINEVINKLVQHQIDIKAKETQNVYYNKAMYHFHKIDAPLNKKPLETVAKSLFERDR